MGCFAKGCLTLIILGFIFLVGMIGCTWFIYVRTVDRLTSPTPADVRIEALTEGQFQAAENSMKRLRTAIANNTETTVELTAADINALIARDSSFEDWRGRTRVNIADSVMTIDLSAPLNTIPLPRLKKRWFNGTASFSFTYENGMFDFDIRSAEAGGHRVPDIFLSSGAVSSFNESMNQSFREELSKNEQGSEFWNRIKVMSLRGDKLVVTTQAE